MLGTHDGFEAQADWRSPHNRPHRCSGTCALPFLRLFCSCQSAWASWWLQRRGGSSRRLLCFWPHSTSTSGTIISGRRVTKQASPRRLPASWCASLRRLAVTSAPHSFSWPSGPSSRLQWRHHSGQTHAGHSPGNSVIPAPNVQALECSRRHFGTCRWVPQGRFRFSLPKQPSSWWSPPSDVLTASQGQNLGVSEGKRVTIRSNSAHWLVSHAMYLGRGLSPPSTPMLPLRTFVR